MNSRIAVGLLALGLAGGTVRAQVQDTAAVPKSAAAKTPAPTVRDEHNKPIEGTCKVSLTVDTQGHPKHVHTEMCTDKRLMPYAKDHVLHEVFEPATHSGKPVPLDMMANVFFRAEPTSALVRHLNMKRDLPQESSEMDVSPMDMSDGVTPPELIYSAPATFPQSVRESKQTCKTQVELIVDRDGLPRDMKVLKSCGQEADHNALEALSKYLFKPATKDGKAVAVHATVEVGFTVYKK